MAMGDAVDLLEHWQLTPPAAVTLAAVHLERRHRGPASGPGAVKAPGSEQEALQAMAGLAEWVGPPAPLPAPLRRIVEQAEQLKRDHRLGPPRQG